MSKIPKNPEEIFEPFCADYEALYGVDFELTKAERIVYRESTPTHAMVLTGVTKHEHLPIQPAPAHVSDDLAALVRALFDPDD